MTIYKKINYFIALVLVMTALPALAIDITQQDFGKLGGKASDQVQKAKENYQQTMERISQNQYTTAVGDGIKSAKQGSAWGQEEISSAMKKIPGLQNATNDSMEANLLLLTKEIASAKKAKSDLEANKKEQLAAIDENLKVEQAALEEKIKLSQENIETGISVYEQELKDAETDEEKERIKEEIEEMQQGGTVEQAELEENMKKMEEDAEAQKKALEEELDNQIYAQNEQIADLTQKYEDLLADERINDGETEQEPEVVIEKVMEIFSFKEGESVSLQDRKDKERSRQQRVTTTSFGAFNNAMQNIASIDSIKAQQKIMSGLGDSMTGQSDAIQSAIKSTADQLDGLYSYLLSELKALEAEAAMILTQSTINVDVMRANTDICLYKDKSKATSKEENTSQSAKTSIIGSIAEVSSSISSAAKSVSDTAGVVGDAVNDGKHATENIGMY